MSTPDSSTQDGTARSPTLKPLAPSLGRRMLRWGLVVFGLAALYVLSIGPAVQLNKRGVISAETLERLYFPLSVVGDFPGSQWLLDRYLRLWVDPGPGHNE